MIKMPSKMGKKVVGLIMRVPKVLYSQTFALNKKYSVGDPTQKIILFRLWASYKKADPVLDPDPLVRGTDSDPHQNFTDPQHWLWIRIWNILGWLDRKKQYFDTVTVPYIRKSGRICSS
jgi:hypothetical protein